MNDQNSAQDRQGLDPGILVAWYGDDFTGAAAVMEVLTFAGLPTMLFLDVPTQQQLNRFADLRCVGVASTARTQSPAWMDDNLPKVFDGLAALNPAIVHYKVCSTLDSSPTTGSIGRATEIGCQRFGSDVVPVMIAAPQMQRYQCFGHLFAGVGDEVIRLDRHPVMSRHPVTPMTESDVALHISRQSDRIDGLYLPLTALEGGTATLPSHAVKPGRIDLITLDSTNLGCEIAAGGLIWQGRQTAPFVVGSQGIEFALVEHWIDAGLLDRAPAPQGIGPSKGMVTVSGSVSPTTAQQIAWATENGFAGLNFDATSVCQGTDAIEAEMAAVTQRALDALEQGLDPLIYTAAGPDDPAVDQLNQAVATSGADIGAVNQEIGETLGRVLKRIIEASGLRRAVVSGGDTSGFATRQLEVFALSALAPTIPGASIFRVHSDGAMDGLELALKGGQMGSPDYFGWVRNGGGARA